MKIDLESAKTLPGWLVRMAKVDLRRRVWLDEQIITVTSLLQPTPILKLTDRYWDEIKVDVLSSIPSLLGNAWHEVAARHDDTTEGSEVRMEVEFDGWAISGQPDHFDVDALIDRKTAKVWSRVFGKPEWEAQLNVYRWLVERAMGWAPSRLEIHVVYVDWTESVAKRGQEYPQSRFERLEVPIWEDGKAETLIREKLADLEAREFGICTPEERWERGESWAVMKPGRKSALKLCDSQAQAVMMAENIPGAWVDHREGDPVRCRSWCNVREFCPFGRTLSERQADRDSALSPD